MFPVTDTNVIPLHMDSTVTFSDLINYITGRKMSIKSLGSNPGLLELYRSSLKRYDSWEQTLMNDILSLFSAVHIFTHYFLNTGFDIMAADLTCIKVWTHLIHVTGLLLRSRD